MSETPAAYITSASPVVVLALPQSPLENPYRAALVIAARNYARAHAAYERSQCVALLTYLTDSHNLFLGCAERYEEAELMNDG